MLSIFRTNHFFASILLIFYAFILRIASLIVPATNWKPLNDGVLSATVYGWLGTDTFASDITAIILVFLQAVLLNYIITEHRIASTVSLFPGVFYILICSAIPDFMHLSPALMANTFLILAIYEISETYKRSSSATYNYNIGLWIGISSLFYFSYALFFFLGWTGLNIMRAFNLRERLMLLAGFISPYFLAFTYYYWHNNLSYFTHYQFTKNISFLDFMPQENWTIYAKLGLFLVLMLISVLNYNNYVSKKNIRAQKSVNVLYWAALLSIPTLIIQAAISPEHFMILAIPLGAFMSFSFINMSKPVAEALHIILVAGAISWHLLPAFGFSL